MGRFPIRLELGRCLAHIAGVTVCSPLMDDNRADRQAQGLDMLCGLLPLLPLRAGFVDDNKGRRVAGELQEVGELWQGLKSEQMRRGGRSTLKRWLAGRCQ